MPNLGPGVPANTSVTPVATLVFTPTPGVAASCRISNPGPGIVYLGGPNVSPGNGFPVLPGNRPIQLQNVGVPLYACSGVGAIGAAGTTAAVNAAGSTLFTVATVSPTVGTYMKLGSGSSVEYVLVSGTVGLGGSPWTVTTSASVYDHVSGSTAATVLTAYPGPLLVSAGVV